MCVGKRVLLKPRTPEEGGGGGGGGWWSDVSVCVGLTVLLSSFLFPYRGKHRRLTKSCRYESMHVMYDVYTCVLKYSTQMTYSDSMVIHAFTCTVESL